MKSQEHEESNNSENISLEEMIGEEAAFGYEERLRMQLELEKIIAEELLCKQIHNFHTIKLTWQRLSCQKVSEQR